MELVLPNREKMTGSAIKVQSMKLVPPNKEKWFRTIKLISSQGRIYNPLPDTLEDLLQHAEEVIDDLNSQRQQARHGGALCAQDEGKGGGLRCCWWWGVRRKESLNCSTSV